MTDAEIIENIRSSDLSLRLGAIQWAMEHRVGDQSLGAFRKQLPREADEECRLLIGFVLRKRDETTGSGLREPPPASVPTAIPAEEPVERKLEFLEGLRSSRIPSPTQEKMKEWMKSEGNPTILSQLIRTCGPAISEADTGWLEERLQARSAGVRLAAAEVLFRRFPALLRVHLPSLLVSPDLCLRMFGIEALVDFDPEEAADHIRYLLLAESPEERIAGLRCSIFLPFDKVKDPLLQLLAMTPDVEIAEKVCLFFQINPDPETPFRLWEILEQSPPGKREVINQTIREAGKALEISGILGGRFQEYAVRLREWVNRKVARRMVRQCLSTWIEADPGRRVEIVQLLRREGGRPFLRETVADLRKWPLSDPERAAAAELQEAIESDSPGVSPRAEEKAKDGDVIPRLALWPEERKAEIVPVLKGIFGATECPPNLLAAGFRAANRLRIPGFEKDAWPLLRSPAPELVEPALEYLGSFSFDSLMPHLGRFLKDPRTRVRAAALNLLQGKDPAQATGAVFAMLKRGDPGERHLALTCLIHFDFALVRASLAGFITTSFSEAAFHEILILFEANPDPGNLWELFRLERLLPEKPSSEAKEARARCEQVLIEAGVLPPAETGQREAALVARWEKENKRLRAPPPAYAARVLHAGKPLEDEGSAREIFQKAVGFGLAAAAATLLSTMVFFSSRGPVSSAPITMGRQVEGGIEVSGKYQKIDLGKNRWRFIGDDGRVFLLPIADFDATIPVGNPVKIRLTVGSATEAGGPILATWAK